MPCKPLAGVVFPVDSDATGYDVLRAVGAPFLVPIHQQYLRCGQMVADA